VSAVAHRTENGSVLIWCPGCGFAHAIRVEGDKKWEWNGSLERPSFQPSLKCEWDDGPERTPKCCHSVITDGFIDFCPDSTHALRGQRVALEPF
jgi:hypothetical protein